MKFLLIYFLLFSNVSYASNCLLSPLINIFNINLKIKKILKEYRIKKLKNKINREVTFLKLFQNFNKNKYENSLDNQKKCLISTLSGDQFKHNECTSKYMIGFVKNLYEYKILTKNEKDIALEKIDKYPLFELKKLEIKLNQKNTFHKYFQNFKQESLNFLNKQKECLISIISNKPPTEDHCTSEYAKGFVINLHRYQVLTESERDIALEKIEEYNLSKKENATHQASEIQTTGNNNPSYIHKKNEDFIYKTQTATTNLETAEKIGKILKEVAEAFFPNEKSSYTAIEKNDKAETTINISDKKISIIVKGSKTEKTIDPGIYLLFRFSIKELEKNVNNICKILGRPDNDKENILKLLEIINELIPKISSISYDEFNSKLTQKINEIITEEKLEEARKKMTKKDINKMNDKELKYDLFKLMNIETDNNIKNGNELNKNKLFEDILKMFDNSTVTSQPI
jgi:hypothetical protein